jgi:hypothetical protein
MDIHLDLSEPNEYDLMMVPLHHYYLIVVVEEVQKQVLMVELEG